ncbi:diiron oxygenase [Streptomyces sp. SL13]|uniref:Diiron oxygenase n=1 Tax=Streptantibioticus silvisoli TaxID=2705255 RepID=A0AA90H9Q7_9ACTN|nr:diiron oxygenase [Streptantibioticus silvisoli]MDI5973795.1 diiron oxygenase [Streptantibioticus silvisoli]
MSVTDHEGSHGSGHDSVIDEAVLRRIADSWPRRATIRTDMDRIAEPEEYDHALPDYPVRLLPFAEHPLFLAASPEQRQQVLTMAWLVYNERVVAAEERVANPTFAMVIRGDFPGADGVHLKRAVQQTHVDEVWHTYMHMIAMQRTREVRQVTGEPEYPHTVIYRRLLEAEARTTESWERDLLKLVWTTVSEVSVNAYLELLSRDETVQPLHALVPRLHARDESAHSSVVVEVAKALYVHMNAEQRRVFVDALPKALNAFVAQDFAVWPGVLRAAGFERADEIVADCRAQAGNNLLVRDFSGVRRIVREMELDDLVDFDFGAE